MHKRIIGDIQYPQAVTSSYVLTYPQLVCFRVFAVIYLSITTGFSCVNHFSTSNSFLIGLKYFTYFTNLNLLGLLAYFIYSLYLTYCTHFHSKYVISRCSATIHSIMYILNCAYHPLVVTVYWVLLNHNYFDHPDPIRRFVSISTHGITLILVMMEIFLGGMQLNSWGILPVLLILSIYTGCVLIYYVMSQVFVYSFMDFTKPEAVYMYLGIAIAAIVFFYLLLAVHTLKAYIFANRKLNHSSLSSMKEHKANSVV